jgi:hypothetical protein
MSKRQEAEPLMLLEVKFNCRFWVKRDNDLFRLPFWFTFTKIFVQWDKHENSSHLNGKKD